MTSLLLPSSTLRLTLLVIISSTYLTSAYYFNGYSTRDLEKNDTCFITETTAWEVSKIRVANSYTTCVGTYLLGGYGVLGNDLQLNDYYSRTYTDLPGHNMIYFSFSFWAIDSWNGSPDYFLVQIDSKTFTGWKTLLFSDWPSNICGASNQDLADIRIVGKAIHSGPSVTFRVVSKLDQISTNEAIGIRSINLLFVSFPASTTENMCGRASVTMGVGDCYCPTGQYQNSTSCLPCHPNCVACFGPNSNQCYECKVGYTFNGTHCAELCHPSCVECSGPNSNQCTTCSAGYLNFEGRCIPAASCSTPLIQGTSCQQTCTSPCTNPAKFVYWNGTCLWTCPAPYIQSTMLTTVNLCLYPCSASQYLYWDGTCMPTCDYPLQNRTENGKQFCSFNCGYDYQYWDGSCSSACVFPLTQSILKGKNFCNYPCSNTSHFVYWNGTCLPTCKDPLVQRTFKGRNFCDYPCYGGLYLYWDKTCSLSCVPPRITRTEGQRDYCDFPCTGNDFLYFNGSCKSSCPAPYVHGVDAGKNFCNYPCGSSQYLYWNSTCSPVCDAPLKKRQEITNLFCEFPCTGLEYLYWNGTCNANCGGNLVKKVEGGKNFCNRRCNTTQFLYWNNSCLDSCKTPLVRSSDGVHQLCNYPCDAGEYLFPNSSCTRTCLAPYGSYKKDGLDYCDLKCPKGQYLLQNGTCVTSCEAPLHLNTTSKGTYCYLPCPDSEYYEEETKLCLSDCTTSFVYEREIYLRCLPPGDDVQVFALSKTLHALRYVQADYPLGLETMSVSRGNNIMSLRVPGFLTEIQKLLPNLPLPSEYQKPGLSSSFLSNFIDDLAVIGGLLALEFLFMILEVIFTKTNRTVLQSVFKKLRILTKWNLPLLVIATNIGDIFFFAVLEFRTYDPAANLAIASLAVSIVMLTAAVGLLVGTALLVRGLRIAKSHSLTNKGYNTFFIKWQNFQILFGGHQDGPCVQPVFFLIYCLRHAIPMLVAAFLSGSPLAQVIVYVAINGLIISYIVLIRPIKRKVDLINLLALELIMLAANLSVLMLLKIDPKNKAGKRIIGYVMLASNYGLTLLPVVFLVVKGILIVKQAMYFRNEDKPRMEKSTWLQLIFLPFQQGGFCFEQVSMDEFARPSSIKKVQPKKKPAAPRLERLETQANRTVTLEAPQSPTLLEKPEFVEEVETVNGVTNENVVSKPTRMQRALRMLNANKIPVNGGNEGRESPLRDDVSDFSPNNKTMMTQATRSFIHLESVELTTEDNGMNASRRKIFRKAMRSGNESP